MLQVSRRVRRAHEQRPRLVPTKDWSGILTINSGLSVVVCGHLIDLDRDHERRIATVQVRPVDGQNMTEMDESNIKQASDLLADRARRFLGSLWTVVRWTPPAGAVGCAG